MSDQAFTIEALSRLLLSHGIVSACSRHHIFFLFTLNVSSPCTHVVLDKVLSLLCPRSLFSQLMSGKQAVGEVASANQMFTNSNPLIVLDQVGFNRQNQIQTHVFFFFYCLVGALDF